MKKLPIQIELPESFFLSETRCDYEVTQLSKQHWAILLDLMVQFDSVCKEHGIQYAIDGGTFLGAVRHKGFIPWDNDVDVIMLRSEYNRFCQIAPTAFKFPYFWQTNVTDPGTLRRHGQLRNSLTTCILSDEMQDGKPLFDFNQGVFLDVFILDAVPDDADELKSFEEELQQNLSLLWDFKNYYRISGKALWMKEAQQQAFEEFEKYVSRYNAKGQRRIGNISLIPRRRESMLFAKEIYDDLIDYDFEGFSFPGPRDYDTILTGLYGDWHKFVIGDDRHGDTILDVYSPYTEYVKDVHADSPLENPDERHPILQLYKHRDTLLKQRDIAWKDIQQMRDQQEQLQKIHMELKQNLNESNNINQILQKRLKKLRIALYILSIFVLIFMFLFFLNI